MSMTISKDMAGWIICVVKLTMTPHGATLQIQISDGKNVIVIKKMVKSSERYFIPVSNYI